LSGQRATLRAKQGSQCFLYQSWPYLLTDSKYNSVVDHALLLGYPQKPDASVSYLLATQYCQFHSSDIKMTPASF